MSDQEQWRERLLTKHDRVLMCGTIRLGPRGPGEDLWWAYDDYDGARTVITHTLDFKPTPAECRVALRMEKNPGAQHGYTREAVLAFASVGEDCTACMNGLVAGDACDICGRTSTATEPADSGSRARFKAAVANYRASKGSPILDRPQIGDLVRWEAFVGESDGQPVMSSHEGIVISVDQMSVHARRKIDGKTVTTVVAVERVSIVTRKESL